MFRKNKEFYEGYNNYYPLIFSVVHTKVGNRDDSEDICQEIFFAFYEKFDTIENHRKWLFGTMRYQLINYYKRKHKNNVDVDEVMQDVSLTFVNGFKDIRIIIEEAIENSVIFDDDTEATLFDLVAIHNFSYTSAASQLGLTKRQVQYKYNKIVSRFLDYLNRKGIKNIEDLL